MVVTSCISVQYLWKYGFAKSSDNLYAPCTYLSSWITLCIDISWNVCSSSFCYELRPCSIKTAKIIYRQCAACIINHSNLVFTAHCHNLQIVALWLTHIHRDTGAPQFVLLSLSFHQNVETAYLVQRFWSQWHWWVYVRVPLSYP